jgi:subtilisin-like proprotein convertase family protein
MDASVPGCITEIETVALPEACRPRTWTATNLPASIPSNSPAGLSSQIGVNEPTIRRNALVEVNSEHPNRNDLTVALIEPSGSRKVLHARTGGSADNLQRRFFVPISGPPNGAWKLQAIDGPTAGTGTLRSWSIRRASSCASWLPCFAGLGEYCTSSDSHRPSQPLALPDGDGTAITRTFQITTPGTTGDVEVDVWLNHPRGSDLEIDLRAPGGRVERIWDRAGGNAPLESVFVRAGHLADVNRVGTWTLTVRDRVPGAQGTLRGWRLATEPLCR